MAQRLITLTNFVKKQTYDIIVHCKWISEKENVWLNNLKLVNALTKTM